MLLAVVRALFKPPCIHHTGLVAARTYSSSQAIAAKNENGSSTWRSLNRIPTPAAIRQKLPEINTAKSTTIFPPEIEALYRGNQRFRDAIAESATPGVLRDLAKQGQRASLLFFFGKRSVLVLTRLLNVGPPFLLLDCSDSRYLRSLLLKLIQVHILTHVPHRVGEQVIFSAEPGTLFTTGNVANQFLEHDLNSYVPPPSPASPRVL